MGSYWRGVALGLLVVVAAIATLWIWPRLHGRGLSPAETALVIDPPFVDLTNSWILPGASREFKVALRNRSGQAVWIDELRFTCPCASGALLDGARLPVKLAARTSTPIRIQVKSEKGESGPVKLQYGVVGHRESELISVGAVAAVSFVQALNSEPSLISLGEVLPSAGVLERTVTLWSPAELGAPLFEAESDDPCLKVTSRRLENASATVEKRIDFAQLQISIDPAKAPNKLHGNIVVTSGDAKLIIPVLGFFRPSQPENVQP
jgi:hypothetical protein